MRNKQMRGDHYVTLVVQVPDHLNEAQREALMAFDATMNNGTRRDDKKKRKSLFNK